MNYETLELEILARILPINTVNSNIAVAIMPEVAADRSRPLPTKAKVTIIYAGSEYSLVNSTSYVKQDEKIFIQLLIESTFLRGTEGVYNIIEALKTLLVGYRPTYCMPLQMVKHHTIGGEDAEKINNMWAYNMILQTNGAITVENFEEEFITNALKKITFVDVPGGEINEVPNPNNTPD